MPFILQESNLNKVLVHCNLVKSLLMNLAHTFSLAGELIKAGSSLTHLIDSVSFRVENSARAKRRFCRRSVASAANCGCNKEAKNGLGRRKSINTSYRPVSCNSHFVGWQCHSRMKSSGSTCRHRQSLQSPPIRFPTLFSPR